MKENTNKILLAEVKEKETFKTEIGEFIVLEHLGDKTKVITKNLFEEN